MEGEKCLKYKRELIQVTVNLPEWGQGCRHCKLFFRRNQETGVYYCAITGEHLNPRTIDNYPGVLCPIEWMVDHG